MAYVYGRLVHLFWIGMSVKIVAVVQGQNDTFAAVVLPVSGLFPAAPVESAPMHMRL